MSAGSALRSKEDEMESSSMNRPLNAVVELILNTVPIEQLIEAIKNRSKEDVAQVASAFGGTSRSSDEPEGKSLTEKGDALKQWLTDRAITVERVVELAFEYDPGSSAVAAVRVEPERLLDGFNPSNITDYFEHSDLMDEIGTDDVKDWLINNGERLYIPDDVKSLVRTALGEAKEVVASLRSALSEMNNY